MGGFSGCSGKEVVKQMSVIVFAIPPGLAESPKVKFLDLTSKFYSHWPDVISVTLPTVSKHCK